MPATSYSPRPFAAYSIRALRNWSRIGQILGIDMPERGAGLAIADEKRSQVL